MTVCRRRLTGGSQVVPALAARTAGTRSQRKQVVTGLLAGLQLCHPALNSLLVVAALHAGEAPSGYLDGLSFLGLTLLGNSIGGLGL